MKLRVGDVEVEGTLQEVMAFKAEMARLEESTPVRVLPKTFDPALDAVMIQRFENEYAATPPRVKAVVKIIHELRTHVAPKSLMAATKEDVQAFIEKTMSRCRNLYTFNGRAKLTGFHRCDEGIFGPSGTGRTYLNATNLPGEIPSFCNSSCSKYRINAIVAARTIEAVTTFYNYFEDELERHPSRQLMRRYNQTIRPREHLKKRYCPTNSQLQRIVLQATPPETKVFVMLATKTGRREDEIRRILWTDIDLDTGVIDMERVRQEKLKAAQRGYTKMHIAACQWSFVDDEGLRILRWYKDQVWGSMVKRDARNQPVTQSIFLGRSRAGPPSNRTLWSWVAAAVEEVGLGEQHLPGADQPITPHTIRHWFTTELQREGNNAPRNLVLFLRGDVMGEAARNYEHLPADDLRIKYRRHMPKLGI